MDPDGIAESAPIVHGSDPDAALDFSANCNPRVPADTTAVYSSAFERAQEYPADYGAFRNETAAFVDCKPEQVVPTAGGMAAIRLAIATTTTPDGSVALCRPTFGEYAREITLQGARVVSVPESEILQIDPRTHDLVIICTPNNPTGWLPDRSALRSFVERCRETDTAVLLDEAFLGFTDQRSLAGTPGVIVARSLTKLFGLPGLRMGSVIATDTHLERLKTAVTPWPLSVPAAAVAVHCLQSKAFIAETKRRVRRERSRLREALAGPFDVQGSQAPFLLLDVGTPDRVGALSSKLRAEGIAIRDATTFDGLNHHVRIAVRTADENDQLIAALTDGVD
ncbi:aminotransferase class I/II-fold pyridoxal phosphate-dependent enzyme [Halocatena halophila]|uniref:aminotransferase class I/II-fold pyridoxal phosphate-dependent enzyme n=1 Tax=Halocatena halophila TaxID=2814576 RepID=UPI002ED1DC0C